ncbi:histone-lysine N-methyltransferase PRDM9 isoform X12 [Aethina tumida]|uniref:histone-lysine N-methyltransferase PRDM9 isoform X12 n=1 Tax=Aethina tumida TaxID=116153 RepID=UPI0021482012|nr:histone-lysine N-methyltransferase PRDM9 isoform X12 [Aethina tumida]
MDNGGDILQLCRLCLVKDQVNIPIFEEQGDIRQIFLKISSCLPVKVTPDDKLPKKICDGCSCKLDMLYEFWNTTANAEKQLVSWLDQAGLKANTETADQTMSVVAQQVSSKPSETVVKEEAADEIFMEEITFSEKWEEASSSAGPSATITSDEPPPKRARRAAAVRASLNVAAESDDEDDLDTELTKIEDESEDEDDAEVDDPSYVDAPSTSADDQPGPSGVGKDGGDAPGKILEIKIEVNDDEHPLEVNNPSNNTSMEHKLETIKTEFPDIIKQEEIDEIQLKYELEAIKTECPSISNAEVTDEIQLNYELKTIKTECPSISNADVTDEVQLNNELETIKTECPDLSKPEEIKEINFKSLIIKRTAKGTKRFICDICGKGFCRRIYLSDHRLSHFGQEGPYHCHICGNRYLYKQYLKNHLNIHSKSYDCKTCGKLFATKKNLHNHFNTHCERSKFCVICKNQNSSPDTYVNKRCTHDPEELPMLCETCGKVMKQKQFPLHMRCHLGIKPYSCKSCDKSFTTKHLLKVHQRVHTGEKPYVCTTCGRGFTIKATLDVHIRTHTGETPYKCAKCRRGFISKAAINSHIKTCLK